MSKTPDKKDVKNIIVSMADGSTWEAIWDEHGLKLVKEVTPPKGGGDPFQDLLEEFEEEQESKDNEAAEEEQEGGQPEEEEESEEDPQEEQPAQGAGGSPPPPKEIPPSELEPISDNAFKARLQSIMRDNMYDRRTPNKSRGKLDMKKLFRVKTGATNVFTQKEAKKNKKYSVVLCVDTSSSMADLNDEKNIIAADATALLVKTLQLAGIDVAVVGFGPVLILKDFSTHADKKMLGYIHKRVEVASGNTPMYEGMYVGYQLLKGREGHKLMIVMADGSPKTSVNMRSVPVKRMKKDGSFVTSDIPESDWTKKDDKQYRSDQEAYYGGKASTSVMIKWEGVERFHNLTKQHKDIDTVGIGIIDHGMGEYIKDSKIINNIEELKPVIVHEIKKRVRRG